MLDEINDLRLKGLNVYDASVRRVVHVRCDIVMESSDIRGLWTLGSHTQAPGIEHSCIHCLTVGKKMQLPVLVKKKDGKQAKTKKGRKKKAVIDDSDGEADHDSSEASGEEEEDEEEEDAPEEKAEEDNAPASSSSSSSSSSSGFEHQMRSVDTTYYPGNISYVPLNHYVRDFYALCMDSNCAMLTTNRRGKDVTRPSVDHLAKEPPRLRTFEDVRTAEDNVRQAIYQYRTVEKARKTTLACVMKECGRKADNPFRCIRGHDITQQIHSDKMHMCHIVKTIFEWMTRRHFGDKRKQGFRLENRRFTVDDDKSYAHDKFEEGSSSWVNTNDWADEHVTTHGHIACVRRLCMHACFCSFSRVYAETAAVADERRACAVDGVKQC